MALVRKSPSADREHAPRHLERNCEGLVTQLGDPDAATRRWAARDLADCATASSPLLARLRVETDNTVREVILTTLTRLGDATAVDGLVECMRSEDAHLRNEAIEAMKRLPDAVAPIMLRLLADADSDLRIFAVNILESLRHPDVESWLIAVIERDTHVNVCAAALDLLGEVGSPAALDALRRLEERFGGEPYIRFAAELAIQRIRAG